MTANPKNARGARMDIRSSLTHQFLIAAVIQARSASEMQSRPGDTFTEDDKVAYRGFVTSAIMQSVAALECEIWDVMFYGPGHHLGLPRIEIQARDLLHPLAEVIDRQCVLKRYEMVEPGWDTNGGVATELQGCYIFRLQFCYSSLEVGAGSGFAWMVESEPVTHPNSRFLLL
jgi:hypothetical protein